MNGVPAHKQRRAWAALHAAIRSGKIAPGACSICGNPKAQGHHRDYDYPLDVVWLCKPHHCDAHKGIPPRVVDANGPRRFAFCVMVPQEVYVMVATMVAHDNTTITKWLTRLIRLEHERRTLPRLVGTDRTS